MKLTVKGRHKTKEVNHLLIRNACFYYVDLLFVDDISRVRLSECKLDIVISKDLKSEFERDGICSIVDCQLNPRHISLEIDNMLSKEVCLITIAHEIVHFSQLVTGKWSRPLTGVGSRWCGKLIDDNLVDYYDLPWEIDAHGREYGMYKRFVDNQSNLDYIPEYMHELLNRI